MVLAGLWHGANWTFVVWGALHGFYLWVEKFYRDYRKKQEYFRPNEKGMVEGTLIPEINHPKTSWNFVLALGTFFLVNVTWVFFRSADFTSAWRLLHAMFISDPKGTALLSYLAIGKVSIILVLLVIAHWLMRNTMVLTVAGKMPWWLLGTVWAAMLLLISLSQNASSSFIYFQF